MRAGPSLLLLCGALSACFVDIPLTDRPCSGDEDCLDDHACVEETCVPRTTCDVDGDCGDGESCLAGACRPTPVDAGVDVDAGVEVDAGVPNDAGLPRDAGRPDGGDVDGGAADGGTGDGGASDGGAADGGTGDGGAGPDAGGDDGGLTDAGDGGADAGADGGVADAGFDAGAELVCHGAPVPVCASSSVVRTVCPGSFDAGAPCDFATPSSAFADLVTSGVTDGYLFLHEGRYGFSTQVANGTLHIVGEGDVALYSTSNTILTINGGGRVELSGVEISNDSTGDGSRNGSENGVVVNFGGELVASDCQIGPGGLRGIDVNSGGWAEVRRCEIVRNREGGLDVSGNGIFENNLIRLNGDSGGNGSALGNVRLAGGRVLFRFNTVIDGIEKQSDIAGVRCDSAQDLYASIIRDNNGIEVSGNCTIHDSNVQGFDGVNGSIDQDPQFDGTFHLQAGSPCIDHVADGSAPLFDAGPLTHDYDLDSRPAGSAFDCGHDERP
jgi:hypothetical protein